MSSFWNLSDNTAAPAAAEFTSTAAFELIPAGTKVTAMIDEVKWDEYEGDEYINAKWVIVDGEHKDRRIFQKIRVKDSDQKKSDKALRMLAAIDTNSGGQLMKVATEPTDEDLSRCLEHKPMILKLDTWDMNGRSGNWVQAVSSLNAAAATETPKNFDNDVPF